MKAIFAIAVIFTAFSGAAAAQDRLRTGYPELPRDARNLAERSGGCEHFSGEINGDRGERDRQVLRAMKKLKCGSLEQDAKRIKHKYRNNKKVLRGLSEALEWLAA